MRLLGLDKSLEILLQQRVRARPCPNGNHGYAHAHPEHAFRLIPAYHFHQFDLAALPGGKAWEGIDNPSVEERQSLWK